MMIHHWIVEELSHFNRMSFEKDEINRLEVHLTFFNALTILRDMYHFN